jgi:hypothetical protein
MTYVYHSFKDFMKNIITTSLYILFFSIIAFPLDKIAAASPAAGYSPDMYQAQGGYGAPGAMPYGPGGYPGGAPGFGPGNMPPLSEEDIRQLEQLDHEIKKFVDQMPPDQRAEFDRQVSVMQEKMSTMNGQELAKFMEDTFREAGLIEPRQQPVPQQQPELPVEVPPAPTITEEPVQEEVVEKAKPVHQIEDARAMIEEIIQLTDKIILRAGTIQTIAFQVKKWGQRNQLKFWEANFDWTVLKAEIEKLKQTLHAIKNDKHLGDLIDDKELYEKLETLQITLKESEANFEVSDAFSPDKMTNDSKDALQNILNAYIEALFIESIMPALETLQAKYEPKAKKLREEEEKLSKTALEGSKRTATMAPVRVGGSPDVEGYNPPQTGGAGGAQYPYYPDSGSYGGAPWQGYQQPVDSSNPQTIGKGQPAQGSAYKPSKEEQAKEDDIKRMVSEISSIFDDIDESIEGSPAFKSLRAHLEAAGSYDKQLLKRVMQVTPKLRTAARKAKSIVQKAKDLPGSMKKKQFDALSSLFKEHPAIGQAVDQIRGAEGNKKISAEKKYVYFAGENEAAAVAQNKNIKTEVPEPADLAGLKKEFENYTKTINELNK